MIDYETIRAEERAENEKTRTIIGLVLHDLAYALTGWEDPDDA